MSRLFDIDNRSKGRLSLASREEGAMTNTHVQLPEDQIKFAEGQGQPASTDETEYLEDYWGSYEEGDNPGGFLPIIG
jgi:hypothetical protein